MLRKTDWKILGIGAFIGVVVGLVVALPFFYLVAASIRFDYSWLIGLVIGSCLGSGIAGTCGATRSGWVQFPGSAIGGGVATTLAISFWLATGVSSLSLFDALFVGAIFVVIFSIPSSVLSAIIGGLLGFLCNRIGAKFQYPSQLSALGTSVGTALGWVPMVLLVFVLGHI